MAQIEVSKTWWMKTIRGLAAVFFGLAVVFWPQLGVQGIVYLFSAYVLVVGVVNVWAGVSDADHSDQWWLRFVTGLVELGFGIYLVRNVNVTMDKLILLVGFLLLIRGVLELVDGFLERVAEQRWVAVVVGVLGVVAGIVILFQSTLAFVWLLGLYALIVGAMLLSRASKAHLV